MVPGSVPTAPAAPVAERRIVTILFTDLVGFTTLSEGRDPEEVRELLSHYFEMARDVVERYGGTVEKFIGDAVMAVWGAPVAQEDDAERAVRAGLDLVAAVRSLGPGIQARAGVLTGEAAVTLGAVGQGMVAGDLVNTASRLQSVAVPGTVLVGETTRRAAGLAIAFEPAGEQTLKGKEAPIPAFRAVRVVSERRGRNRAETLEAPFVGRDDELRLLKDLYHATSRDRRARLVSVVGAAGIGKSRLAWEFLKYIDGLAENVWWHAGRSPAYGEGISFWALGEMIRGRCGLLETDDESTTRAKVTATLREHVPDEAERRWIEGALLALLGIGGATTPSAELFGAWRTFFERLSESGTVALVFEDFNNADTGLIDFVDHVLEWSRGRPILVLTLARPDFLERRPDWQAKRNFTSIGLEPLSDAAMHELLTGLVPGLPESAVRSIVGRADGIPLYAVETVRALLAEGRLALHEGRYVPVGDLRDLAVPATLAAVIASRLDALDPGDRTLVHDAAVLGHTFTRAALAAVCGLGEDAIEPRLRGLVRREILSQTIDPRSPELGQYAFVQGLIREVAYNTLAKRDRMTRHLAAARYFEGLSEELAGARAGHYLAAHRNAADGPEADELASRARAALGAAAARATTLGSYEQAAEFCEQALTVATDPAERAAFLERAGAAWSKAGRNETAATNLREAIELHRERGDRRAAARATSSLGWSFASAHLVTDAVAVLEPAVAEFADLAEEPEGVSLVAAFARAAMAGEDYPRAIELSDRALVAAERLDLPVIVAQALMTRGSALDSLGRSYEGNAEIRAGIELAEQGGAREDALMGRAALMASMGGRDVGAALEMGRAGLAEARRLGERARALAFVGNAADAARSTGDWDWVVGELGSFLEGDLDAQDRGWLLEGLIVLRAWRGEDVTEQIAEVEALYHAMNASAWFRIGAADRESCISLAEGRLEEARRLSRDYAALSPLNAPSAYPVAGRAAAWARDATGLREDLESLVATGARGPLVTLRRIAMEAGLAALDGRVQEAAARYAEARRGLLDRGVDFEAALVALDMLETLPEGDAAAMAAAADARPALERLRALPFLERLDEALAGARRSEVPVA